EIGGTKRTYVLTARRPDGTRIEVRTGDHNSAVLYSGQTPALALREPEEFQWPEPVRTPGTLTPGYVLCYECDGLGACTAAVDAAGCPASPMGAVTAASATGDASAPSAGAGASWPSSSCRRTS
ncbi:hypothetical protein PUR32_35380, partial [Streptomyces sp. BE133]|nr:hypothetical protein [Streptomyces sp. BE133]